MTGSTRWLAIFTAHRQRMVAEATKVTGDATSAEDVVQDAWLRLSHGATDTRIIEPASYLRRVVRNLALDHYRHRRRHEPGAKLDPADDPGEMPSDTVDAERRMIASEELAIVTATLATMPPRMRRAVELHRLSGATLREIAGELGVSVTTAHTLVTDGVERCRRALRHR